MSVAEEEFVPETEETKKAKPTEGLLVLHTQMETAKKLKQLTTRAFKLTKVPVVTVGGEKMWVLKWASNSEPHNKKDKLEQPKKDCICDICNRSFLDRRRLAIHKNVHGKTKS